MDGFIYTRWQIRANISFSIYIDFPIFFDLVIYEILILGVSSKWSYKLWKCNVIDAIEKSQDFLTNFCNYNLYDMIWFFI